MFLIRSNPYTSTETSLDSSIFLMTAYLIEHSTLVKLNTPVKGRYEHIRCGFLSAGYKALKII